jgi:glucans biosynthesis protein
MFWHGENTNAVTNDFRPEVHDSDGLLVNTGAGEWLWRPLDNPGAPRVAAFSDRAPKGFGLMQRDRNFENYQDMEAPYHKRPSAWVEPVGDWGSGSVRLVELSTPDETNDNIVAFWVPDRLPAPGEALELQYRLHWVLDQIHPPAGYAIATRHGRTKTHETDLERFFIDFGGPGLETLDADPKVESVVTVGTGATLVHSIVQKNPYNGTWRAAFAIKPNGSGRPVELRCFLRKPDHVLTETWSYLWQP